MQLNKPKEKKKFDKTEDLENKIVKLNCTNNSNFLEYEIKDLIKIRVVEVKKDEIKNEIV